MQTMTGCEDDVIITFDLTDREEMTRAREMLIMVAEPGSHTYLRIMLDVLDHEHLPKGGCRLGDDCPAKGEKIIKVIKLDLYDSGNCMGEEHDLKGDWCDICLK